MATDNKIKSYLERYSVAASNAGKWMDTTRDAYKYSIPQDRVYDNNISGGEKRGQNVYDSTLAMALNRFVSRLSSGLTPAGTNWLSLVAGPDVGIDNQLDDFGQVIEKSEQEKQKEIDDMNRVLADLTRVFFKYVNGSGFNAAMNQCYKDWAIGTGALAINENDDDDDPISFTCVPIDTIAPEVSANGKIKTNWRKFDKFMARDITQQWVRAKLTDRVQANIASDNDYSLDIIEGSVWDNNSKLYNYIVMSDDGESIFLDEESSSSPWVIFRYAVYRDEAFGRGIVMELMPEVKTLNKMREDYLKNSELALNPPLLAFGDSIANMHNIRFEPNSIIPVESNIGGQPSVQQLVSASNFSVAQAEMDTIRATINKALFNEPLGPIESPTKTATEVNARLREVTESLEPASSLLQWEFGQPFVDRVMHILRKRGLIGPVFVDGREISIKFESPLTLSQGLIDASQFEAAFTQMSQVLGPDLAGLMLDLDTAPSKIIGFHGADPTLWKTSEEISELLQGAADAAQAAAVEEARLQQTTLPGQLLAEEALPSGRLSL